MTTGCKALYNLLRLYREESGNNSVCHWQVLDYRSLSKDDLFKMFSDLDVKLNQELFESYAVYWDTPEEFTEALVGDVLDDQCRDQLYLISFELWRRLRPDRRSLSIFFDDLDFAISLYDQDQEMGNLKNLFIELQGIIEDQIDKRLGVEEIHSFLAQYCAHDIEKFLYDFTADQIDLENYFYAKELLEDFQEFFLNKNQFNFLNFRLIRLSDEEQAKEILTKVIRKLEEDSDLELYLDLLTSIANIPYRNILHEVKNQYLIHVQNEEDLLDFLFVLEEAYKVIGYPECQAKVSEVLEARLKESKGLDTTYEKFDPVITSLLEYLNTDSFHELYS